MSSHPTLRRTLSLALVLLGGVLMLFAPAAWIGAVPVALGCVLEVIGTTLERNRQPYRRARYALVPK